MDIKYRLATKSDALGFEKVAAYSWKDTYWNILPNDKLLDRIKRLSNLEELEIKIKSTEEFIENNNGNIFVAVDGDKIIGILEVGKANSEFIEYGRLGAIYLLPEYKGYGIGKELFKMGLLKLINDGYNKMELECLCGNPTIGFYKKYSGKVYKTIDDFIYGVSVKVDIVLFDDLKRIYDNI